MANRILSAHDFDLVPGLLPLRETPLVGAHVGVPQTQELLGGQPALRAGRARAIDDDLAALRESRGGGLLADPVERHAARPRDQLAAEILVHQDVPELQTPSTLEASGELAGR